jgi:Fe-S oxidoreductase
MCNNNGHCRKFDAGTMCPSFRVTRDEQHLTRGRANTLRQALDGHLGDDAMTSERMAQTMSLCVSCKACRRECPTGVDMAKMKIEFRQQWTQRHGLSVRDRLFAFLPHYAGSVSRIALLATALIRMRNRIPLLARLTERWLGLSAQTPLPTWSARPFSASHPAPIDATADSRTVQIPQVILWADTFNNHFDPEILTDARTVLAAAGCVVQVSKPASETRPLCCGRTFLAAGLVAEARTEAARTLRTLAPALEAGAIVVGLEPSCLLTLRDEFLVHRWDQEADGERLQALAQKLAGSALLFEEWLVMHQRTDPLPLQSLPQTRALVHGHCHQKAFGAFEAVLEALRLIPNLRVEAITSSCCGMAGAFGYEKEHAGTSRAMAELDLLPAVRGAAPDTLIVADGTSCRHQIANGTPREALHVAQVLARALRGANDASAA